MMESMKKMSWITLMTMAALASWSLAQDVPAAKSPVLSGRGTGGFVGTLERKVGLTPEQRDAVRGLMAEQRQKSQALRHETDQKIRGLLSVEQKKKFDEVRAAQQARFTRKN